MEHEDITVVSNDDPPFVQIIWFAHTFYLPALSLFLLQLGLTARNRDKGRPGARLLVFAFLRMAVPWMHQFAVSMSLRVDGVSGDN